MCNSGIYIVTLTNDEPISVNAHDPRMAERCIKVTRANCKIGKAKSFTARQRDYHKTFGVENVTLQPIAYTEDLRAAERAILKALGQWRVVSKGKWRTEWLESISADEAVQRAMVALRDAGVAFSRGNTND